MQTKSTTIAIPRIIRFDLVISAMAVVIPFVVSGPQWLTGTVVNSLLVLYALFFPKRNYFAIAALPSIGALAHSVVFGPYTPFLAYFLPCIWIANAVFIHSIQRWKSGMWIGILLKTALLYFSAFLFVRFHIVPALFLSAMGIVQFLTALSGAVLAHTIVKIHERQR